MDTEPDADVEDLYIRACGYNPRAGGEGPGGNEQHVLTYLHKTGAPVGAQGKQRHKIAAFVEVDPRITDDVKRADQQLRRGLYRLQRAASISVSPNGNSPQVWDVENANTNIVGGHAVVLAGYDANGARVISWGQYYTMTWAFFAKYAPTRSTRSPIPRGSRARAPRRAV